ncbi:hypothetical protein [Echinicola salinicaeni]|uniref:hypothetical protein n=1 Tax=Echinicola salinicaeni TaxID=2762757 RepID=UPI001E42BC22|nr:hypothetical protein [Echinicola salinicaeni]
MKRYLVSIILLLMWANNLFAQRNNMYQRTSANVFYGISGAPLLDFNKLLEDRGGSKISSTYRSFGLGYQTRFNDFIIGTEIYQNNGLNNPFGDYLIDYRTSRVFLNVGYAFTEEGKVQLIHFMSIGMGYMNFQMLKDQAPSTMDNFLEAPAQGYILRRNDVNSGAENFGNFLTEIGFELGYDLGLLSSEEVISLNAKFGYSFNPFEESWEIKGMNFDNIQSGPFLRIGAGITLPESNYFYRDATLALNLFYGFHFTKPNSLNNYLSSNGYQELDGIPTNIGIKIIGENRGFMYGVDLYNANQNGDANESYHQSLSSTRVYGNIGHKLLELNNWEIGLMGGIGYASLRYSLLHKYKVDFPSLMDLPEYDGELKKGGLMAKPEAFLSYASSLSKKSQLALKYSITAGYEIPLANYKLADVSMSSYLAGPFLQFGLGIRP